MTKVSVVIPARNSQDTILRTIRSLQNQTYQPHEILVVIGPNDETFARIAIPEGVTVIETNPPKEFLRDAQWKRREGALKARGEVIFFTDSKVIVEESAIENTIELMKTHNASVVAGISPGWPEDKNYFISLVHDKGLVMNVPEFPEATILHSGNFGKTESLPVTTTLVMTQKVFRDIQEDFAVRFSLFASTYDDYVLSWLIVKCGYDILLTNKVVCYHKHRLEWREYLRQISRSGQSAAVMLKMYPDCPFGQRRKFQVIAICVVLLLGLFCAAFTAVIGGLAVVLALATLGYSILGILNLIKARDWRGFFIPVFTIALVLTFAKHFAQELLRNASEGLSFDPSYLQIH